MSAPVRILVVAALSVIALVGLIVRESLARAAGTEVILAMDAIDPRDVLSGHYVQLNFREARPGPAGSPATCPPTLSHEGWTRTYGASRTWVALAPAGDHAAVVGQAPTREAAARLGPVQVRGHAYCFESATAANVMLDVGVDRFYASQAEAERISALVDRRGVGPGPVAAIVSVGEDGRARLKGLRIDGRRLELPPF
ncbi:MAG TPA: GDYXXLXY domain-containing protein [Caulobacteraceae bacterium]|nr:GDYXXLXY domain-containing protein [Caulobacteraceae bacterium]